MRAPLAAAAAAVLLAGCGATPAAVPSPTPTAAGDTGTSAYPSTPPVVDTARTVDDGTISETVKSARRVDAVELNRTGSRPGSGGERYTETSAGDGATYVVLTTRVANNGTSRINLACRTSISTALVDDQQHDFGPIDGLEQLRGNPPCDDQLRPGSVHDMTWAYRVPTTTRVVGWAFRTTADRKTIRLVV